MFAGVGFVSRCGFAGSMRAIMLCKASGLKHKLSGYMHDCCDLCSWQRMEMLAQSTLPPHSSSKVEPHCLAAL